MDSFSQEGISVALPIQGNSLYCIHCFDFENHLLVNLSPVDCY